MPPTTTYTVSVALAVDSAMRRAGVTAAQVSQATSIAPTTISRLLRGLAPFNVSQLDAIARYLNIPVETFTVPEKVA